MYLVGAQDSFKKNIFKPYDDLICDFLNELSSSLLHDSRVKSLPDVVAFAYFCRKANIMKLRKEFCESRNRLGVGIVFHITPSNVHVNFAFSFIFGLLAGNSNIVRVPSKPFPQVDLIISVINQVIHKEKYSLLCASNIFVQYKHDADLTAAFSAQCNARIIWGGDDTINKIRSIAIPPRSIEIAFADRYSLCAMDAGAICSADESELDRLARGFFNDTYLMDQNACSSPHLIIWLGSNIEAKTASEKFWQHIYRVASDRYKLQPVAAVNKFTELCQCAVGNPLATKARRFENLLYVITLKRLPDRPEELRGECGYFYEYHADDLNVIAPVVNEKYQTLTYYGIPSATLTKFIEEHRPPGIDRIVPVGYALDISVIWDGYDLIRTLSRIIDIK